MDATPWDWAQRIVAIAGWGTGAWQWYRRRRAERELADLQRRGDAPFYRPDDTPFGTLWISAGQFTTPNAKDVLCFANPQVPPDLPKGTILAFVMRNDGSAPRAVRGELDGEEITFFREPNVSQANGLEWITLTYDPSKRGHQQTLRVIFEMPSGRHDSHLYTLRHGFHELVRSDPKQP